MLFCRVKIKYECFEKVKLLHSVRLNVFLLSIKKAEDLKKKYTLQRFPGTIVISNRWYCYFKSCYFKFNLLTANSNVPCLNLTV